MMYNEKLAVAIKSAGKVLREFNRDQIYVPFGAEYSIFIKNLNTVRALVKVSIDGQNVDESGEGFVINANSSLDLERFLKNGNLNQGNRFKFIERTGKVEQHRGIQVEDGLVRVEFQFEKPLPKVEYNDIHHYERHIYHRDYWNDPWRPGWPYYRPLITYTNSTGGAAGGSLNHLVGSAGAGVGSVSGEAYPGVTCNAAGESGGNADVSVNLCNVSFSAGRSTPTMDSMINEAGITVPGSKSDQQFVTVGSFPLEDATHVIVLKLLGETAQGKRVAKAVTVKTTQRCTTCGHVNKATAKFCTECGTALEIV